MTLNRKHFVRLHQKVPQHGGILVCSFDIDYLSLSQRIHQALQKHGDFRDTLVRINRPG